MPDIEDQLKNKVRDVGKAAQEVYDLYEPALKRMSVEEVYNWIKDSVTKKDKNQLDALRHYMTPQELADEKVKLSSALQDALDDNNQKQKFANDFIFAVLKTVVISVFPPAALIPDFNKE